MSLQREYVVYDNYLIPKSNEAETMVRFGGKVIEIWNQTDEKSKTTNVRRSQS